MNEKNKKYIEKLNETFDNTLGIISLKSFNIEYDLDDLQKEYNITSSKKIIEKFKLTFEEQKYSETKNLLIHFNNYAAINNIYAYKQEQHIYSFYLATKENPFKYLIKYLEEYRGTIKLIKFADMIANFDFYQLFINQYRNIRQTEDVRKIFIIDNNFYQFDNNIKTQIKNLLDKYQFNRGADVYYFLKELSKLYKNLNLSYIKNIEEYKDSEFSNKKEEIKKKPLEYYNIDFTESIEKILKSFGIEDLLNPELTFLNKMQDKYTKFYTNLDKDNSLCALLKTVIYAASYLTRDSLDFFPSQRLQSITDVSSRWAVGDEHNLEPSFYGDSDFVKAFAAYYAFMNGERNPLYEIIDNRLVNVMDEEAMKIHRYFNEYGIQEYLYKLIYDKDIAGNKSLYELIGTVKELIEIIESPISATTFQNGLLSQIKGMISSIINATAQMLEFSVTSAMKELFYVPFIPIGETKVSLSDVYNYLIFFKMILEGASGDLQLENISREEFVSEAYRLLGIREKDIKKIGYCAFDYEMTDKSGLNMYQEYLVKNSDGTPFNVRHDLKLLYSLIKFGIQKYVYENGDTDYYYNFDYGNISLITKTINSLNSKEMFYIFSLYGLNFDDVNFSFADFNAEDTLEYNKQLRDISLAYHHNSSEFYTTYLYTDNGIMDQSSYYYIFSASKYKVLIREMINIYSNVIRENKRNIDKLVFKINDITDIDDFVMRVLPSLIELAKTFGINNIGISYIIKMLDYICYFISDLLFRNLFIKIKFQLIDLIKQYTNNLFEKLDKEFETSADYVIKFDLGGVNIVKKLDQLMDILDNVTLTSIGIQKCFKEPNFSLNNFYKEQIGDIDYDEIILNKYDENKNLESSQTIPSEVPDYLKPSDEIIINKYGKPSTIITDPINNEIIDKIISVPKDDGKKLIYNNGEIFLQNGNGDRIKIIYHDDTIQNGVLKKTITEEITKEIVNIDSNSEFELMIEIRDFIQNLTNASAINIINKMAQIDKEIVNENKKRIPDYNIINNLQKEYQNLTKELERAKNENNIFISNDSISTQSKNYSNQTNNDSDIIISNDYENDLQEKKDLLQEIEEIIVKNNSPLTNFEIIQLLK